MRRINKQILRSTAALIAVTTANAGARAQDVQNSFVEEIMVTAQKRSESVQDIPLTISAFGEEKLQATGFDAISDLANLTPSLQFGNFGPIAFVAVRGIGTENTTAGGDPGVALHYDGIYLGRPVGSLFTAFDSDRVEILKGPQGTLYGRNATGGSINYITKKPEADFGGQADLLYGNFNWVRARAAVNVPINDKVSTRFVSFFEDRDGFSENTVPGGTEANDAENWGIRGHINVEFNDTTQLLLSANYAESNGVGFKAEHREAFPGSIEGINLAGPPVGAPDTVNYVVNGVTLVNDLDAFREAKDTRERQDNDFLLISATLQHDFGPVMLKSITGYVESSYLSSNDSDGSSKALANLVITEEAEQFSQELQLLSNTDSPLQWIGGLFYFNEKASRFSRFFEGRFDLIAQANGVESGFNVGGNVESTSYAAFAQLSYDVTDTFTLTAGARYTDDEKEGNNIGFQFGLVYDDDVGESWNEFTYRLAADWQVAPDTLLFASYSTGYKSGGINQIVVPSLGRNPIYDPESVSAIEVGLKSTVLDGRLRINAALFRNEYDDLQFQVFELGGPSSFNADGAVVQGLEVELQAYVTESFAIDATLGLTDSEFDDQVLGGVDIGGNQVQRTPDVTFSIGVSNEWDFNTLGVLRARADVSYTDEIFYNAFNRAGGFSDPGGSDLAEDYTNVNLRLLWHDNDDKWNAEVFVTNLFDTVQEGNVFRGIGFLDVPGGGGPEQVTYNPPRQFGIQIGRKF